mmetsp:Transcript_57354/g.136325  ORF Transcript_57354/g.136325 Transcript_57354/m.136325 type:complete len:635 (-) Transcript_57354:115-2019(-)
MLGGAGGFPAYGELLRERSEQLNAEASSAGDAIPEKNRPRSSKVQAKPHPGGALPNRRPGEQARPAVHGHKQPGTETTVSATAAALAAEGPRPVVTVVYKEGEEPMAELLRLSGGQGSQVIVDALAPESRAALAGVRAGYALVSMNGHNEFAQLPGWQVRLLLEAPITLSFEAAQPAWAAPAAAIPTASHTSGSEIRIMRPEMVGIPNRVAVCGPKDHGVLAEEVIFKPSSASLFLRTEGQSDAAPVRKLTGQRSLQQLPEQPALLGPQQQIGNRAGGSSHLLELRRRDANQLVGRAVRGARKSVSRPDPTSDPEALFTQNEAGEPTGSPSAPSRSPQGSPSSRYRLPASSPSQKPALPPTFRLTAQTRHSPRPQPQRRPAALGVGSNLKAGFSSSCVPLCASHCIEDDAASVDSGIQAVSEAQRLPGSMPWSQQSSLEQGGVQSVAALNMDEQLAQRGARVSLWDEPAVAAVAAKKENVFQSKSFANGSGRRPQSEEPPSKAASGWASLPRKSGAEGRKPSRSPLRWLAPAWMNPLLDLVDGGDFGSSDISESQFGLPGGYGKGPSRSPGPGRGKAAFHPAGGASPRPARSLSPQPRIVHGDSAIADHETIESIGSALSGGPGRNYLAAEAVD